MSESEQEALKDEVLRLRCALHSLKSEISACAGLRWVYVQRLTESIDKTLGSKASSALEGK